MAEICNVCGLPDELCICQEIAKEQQKATISTDRRRYGKIVTKVEGILDTAIDINQLAKLLKNRCAAGGTVKGRVIELQGCLLYTSPSPRDMRRSRMPSSA